MDNTFSTPLEDFPPQEVAYNLMKDKIVQIRNDNKDAKIYIYCYTLGKEEVLVNLARDLNTKIQILKERWHRMSAVGCCDHDLFTLREFQPKAPTTVAAKKKFAEMDHPYVFLRAMGNRP